MHPENLFASTHVRTVHHYAAVKTARAEQRRIENVGTVGRRHEDDAFVGFKTVHLDQQLVQGLLALIVSAPETCATVTADSVDFVYEDDARSILLALLEQVADAACAHANEHFHKIRTGD